MNDTGNTVLFFDGVCMLCNRMMQFVIRHDKKKRFRFATLQSEHGRVAKSMIGAVTADSVVLLHNGKYYTKSDAVLRAAVLLGGVWSLLTVGFIVPGFIRNGLYSWAARHRYQWFGRSDTCMVPDASIRDRFLPE
jgi:predicted DCC family thiol-disulfide oxidoreductase YuxK